MKEENILALSEENTDYYGARVDHVMFNMSLESSRHEEHSSIIKKVHGGFFRKFFEFLFWVSFNFCPITVQYRVLAGFRFLAA